MFDALDPTETLSRREERILSFWKEHDIFIQSLKQREGKELFSFYDGPPFATGLPHYGHLLAGTIKDVIPRYKTMKGYYVPRRFGWDCHGLPVENEIEKLHNLSGAASIEEYGIARFNEECRSIVLRYTNEWKTTVERMGRWVDFSKTYKTMDRPFMESVWWVFKELYKKGLVYQGFKVMPFSAKLGTPLSNFEATQNYKEVDDPSLTVSFALEGEENTFLLVWTTTPWTLVSNLAITVGSEIEYVKVFDGERNYIVAKALLPVYFKEGDKVVGTLMGKDLEGKRYEPLFSNFAHLKEEGAFQIICDGFVTLEDGTGLVHTAPGFGEADFFACKARNMPLVCPVDNNGQFTHEVPEFQGRHVKECDKDIIKKLKGEDKVFRAERCHHRYPFCWRSDTPLIYKAVASWFVSVEKIKDDIIKSNDAIYWVPDHLKYGRFGKWLENARDWAISRNRYWGTPIPIWQAEDGETVVIGSVEELEEKTGQKIDDLHRHNIDELTFEQDGKVFHRIPEVFDCWFESGSMPYAQNHYPFEDKEGFQDHFPADFIAEGLDQTRGWFYTLNVLSTALFSKPAFKNVVVNGIILAEDGAKMSKRLKNYPDPHEVIHKYGADATRLYMLNSPVVQADDLRFSEHGVEGVLRQILLPLWHSYSFFLTYARLYKWDPEKDEKKLLENEIDRWMVSLLQTFVLEVTEALDRYDLQAASEVFIGFIDQLTNWYIRRSRRRFWNDEDSLDRRQAFETLYRVLMTVVRVAAPFTPFVSEAIYQNLRKEKDPLSVHMCDFPEYDASVCDKDLELSMGLTQQAVSLGHRLRKEKELKVRQPLSEVFIAIGDSTKRSLLERHKGLIEEELNVQKATFIADEKRFVELQAKPNFPVLGKKVGKLMRQCQQKIGAFGDEEIEALLDGKSVSIDCEGTGVVLVQEDVSIQRLPKEGIVAANEKEVTIALDTHLTQELIEQGFVRELVNKVNTTRKELKLDISDRIHLALDLSGDERAAVEKYEQFISDEVLALSIAFASCSQTACSINGIDFMMDVRKND